MSFNRKLFLSFLILGLTFASLEFLFRHHNFRFYYHPLGHLRAENKTTQHEMVFPSPLFRPFHSLKEEPGTVFQPDNYLFWKLKRNWQGYSEGLPNPYVLTNSLGLRSPEINTCKAPNTQRILCLGDSCTFGFGKSVLESDSYPRCLETMLQKNHPQQKWEVINAGCVGYSSFQGKMYYLREGLKLSPDYVILAFGLNDGYRGQDSDSERYYEMRKLHNRLKAELLNLETYRMWDYLVRYCGYKLKSSGIAHANSSSKEQVPRVPVHKFRENYQKIIMTAKHYKSNVLLMDMMFDNMTYTDEISSIAKKYNLPYLSVQGIFTQKRLEILNSQEDFPSNRDYSSKSVEFIRDYLESDFVHPNRKGHKVIGEMVYEIISETRSFL